MEIFSLSLISFVVILIIFLLCRELNCWYWKINEKLSLLEEIRDLLKGDNVTKDNRELKAIKELAGEDALTFPYTTKNEWVCVCGTHHPLNKYKHEYDEICSSCGRNRDNVFKQFKKEDYVSSTCPNCKQIKSHPDIIDNSADS